MAKGHRSQIKRERNANKDTRPSAISCLTLECQYRRHASYLDAIRGKDVDVSTRVSWHTTQDTHQALY